MYITNTNQITYNPYTIHYKKKCKLWRLFSYIVAVITATIYACGGFPNRHRTGRHKV